ncbi:hypothetical protein F9B85_13780 [Heliorestis acidaminivorans]|uniref:Uncharacterized protein n=1 Tax=Heliorestis acidaminivorans TaxID=553427 RepID=A0A6I0EZF3_9FIRM|nr:hypothetical protein [Heliorestis acidaminivorans]KAB2950893.1 hypothetical protein F9B85_13780 [Heliorestis acidaminivorans]
MKNIDITEPNNPIHKKIIGCKPKMPGLEIAGKFFRELRWNMKKYIFQFSINGQVTIEDDNEKAAMERFKKIAEGKLLEISDGHMLSGKCVGIYNDDGSILTESISSLDYQKV